MTAVNERELLTNRLRTLDSHSGLKRVATTPTRLYVRAYLRLHLDGALGLALAAVVAWTTALLS